MRASILRYVADVKRGVFGGGFGGAGSRLTLFKAAVGVYGSVKGMGIAENIVRKRGNIDLYTGLYTPNGDNVMASGKRGIDANVGGTSSLVQGLHKNRRKY